MKKVVKLTLNVLLVLGLSTSIFANGLSLNSVGPKALGMGGAFVGLANDATAIYWNPAGLAKQGSSINLFFTGVVPFATYQLDNMTTPFGPMPVNIDAKTKSNIYPTGGLMANYRMDKFAFALGVYVPAGLGAEWEGADLKNMAMLDHSAENYLWKSQIGVISISPAVAYEVTKCFTIGAALNINYAMFDLDRPNYLDQNGDGSPDLIDSNGDNIPDQIIWYQYTESSTGIGLGATIGLKYDLEQVSVGLTFKTASTVSMEGDAESIAPIPSKFTRDVTWPMWIGGGIAYKPTKCLTLALDAQYSNWKKLDKLVAKYEDWNQEGEFKLDWKDAVQIRLGGEYKLSPETAIRLGYYYDPAPAPDETLNVLFPSSTNHVGTIGFGHCFGSFRLDAAAEYLFGADRDIAVSADNEMPGIHHLDVFGFSLGVGFNL